MKILYVSSSTIPSRAANSVHVMKMCQAMAKLGHQVRLLTLKRSDLEESGVDDIFAHYGVEPNFEVKPLPFPSVPGRQFVYGYRALREAKAWKPDLVYGRYFPAMAINALAGQPVAWESHERVWDRSRTAKWLAKRLFKAKGFRKLVVISDALRDMYVESGMLEADRIYVSHDAADPSPKAKPLPPAPFKVGYVGGVYPGRGIEMLLDCAKELSDVEFHFVGGTAEDFGKLTDVTLGENVICHGYVSPESVPEIRSGFHSLLAPYQRKVAVWGGSGDTSAFMSPLKIFEYMSAGRPMICSDMPVLREVLNDDNAILVEPDNTKGWVSAIRKLRDEPSHADKVAATALADFEANYTWDIRAERILDALRNQS